MVFFPIDTVKTRLQAKGGFFLNGGWKGIYKGIGSITVASAPSGMSFVVFRLLVFVVIVLMEIIASLFFVTYDSAKIILKPIISNHIKNQNLSDSITHMISASLGEISACFVRVPAEVIKQRTQAFKHNSSLDSLKSILKNENKEGILKGLYRGWGITIMREIPFTIIEYPLYEYLKKVVAKKSNKEKASPSQGALCGSIAGGVAAAITTPLDVIKTRKMLHKDQISVSKLVSSIIKEEGYSSFWRGIGPRTMWMSFGGAIFLGVYETVSSFIPKPTTSTTAF